MPRSYAEAMYFEELERQRRQMEADRRAAQVAALEERDRNDQLQREWANHQAKYNQMANSSAAQAAGNMVANAPSPIEQSVMQTAFPYVQKQKPSNEEIFAQASQINPNQKSAEPEPVVQINPYTSALDQYMLMRNLFKKDDKQKEQTTPRQSTLQGTNVPDGGIQQPNYASKNPVIPQPDASQTYTPEEELQIADINVKTLPKKEQESLKSVAKKQQEAYQIPIFDASNIDNLDNYTVMLEKAQKEQEMVKERDEFQQRNNLTDQQMNNYLYYQQMLNDKEKNDKVRTDIRNSLHEGSGARQTGNALTLNALSIMNSPYRGAQAIAGNVAQRVLGNRPEGFGIQTSGSPYDFQNFSQAVQEETGNRIAETGAGEVGRFLYNTGVSAAESAYNMALTGMAGSAIGGAVEGAEALKTAQKVLQNASLLPFGANAYASTYQEARQRGLDDRSAALTATVSGAAEIITEKVSLDSLWDMARGNKRFARNAIVNALAQAGIEGSEEVASDLINAVADRIINGDRSEYEQNVQSIMMQNGGDEADARRQATRNFIKDVGMSFLGGAISGGVMGTAATAVGTASNQAQANQMFDQNTDYAELADSIDTNRDSYENKSAYQSALKAQEKAVELDQKQKSGETITNKDKRNLYTNMMDAVQVEAESRESAQEENIAEPENTQLSEEDTTVPAENTTITPTETTVPTTEQAAPTTEQEAPTTAPVEEKVIDNEQESVTGEQYSPKNEPESNITEENNVTSDVPEKFKSQPISDTDMYTKMFAAKNPADLVSVYQQAMETGDRSQQNLAQSYLNTLTSRMRTRGVSQADIDAAMNTPLTAQTAYEAGLTMQEIDTNTFTPFMKEAYNEGYKVAKIARERNTTVQKERLAQLKETYPTAITRQAFEKYYVPGMNADAYQYAFDRAYNAGRQTDTFTGSGEHILDTINKSWDSFKKNYNILFSQISENKTQEIFYEGIATASRDRQDAIARSNMEKMTAVKGNGTFSDLRANPSADAATRTIAGAARLFGLNIELRDTIEGGSNGYYDAKRGTIVLNASSGKTLVTLAHELGEFTDAFNTEEFQPLVQSGMQTLNEILGEKEYQEMRRAYEDAYVAEFLNEKRKKTDADLDKEIFCDNIFTILGSEEGMNNLISKIDQNCTVPQAKTIKEKLSEMIGKVIDAFKSIISGGNLNKWQQAAAEDSAKRMQDLQDRLTSAMANAAENYRNSEKTTEGEIYIAASRNSISLRASEEVNAKDESIRNAFTYTEDGRLALQNPKELSTEQWNTIAKQFNRLGYDIGTGKNAKEIYSNIAEENKRAGREVGYILRDDMAAALTKAFKIGDDSQLTPQQDNTARNKQYATKAARHFGTTSRFDLAGYLTINGSLLDFSEGQGMRVQDHREISEILDLPDDADYSDGLIEFMNQGNIRMQSYGIDISVAPNEAQRKVLARFFDSLGGEVAVDFSREDGSTAGSAEYREGTSYRRILNDIDNYFETGEIPAGNANDSFRWSREVNSEGTRLTKDQQEYFKDSKVRTPDGSLKVMYHGTPTGGFTVFKNGLQFFTENKEYADRYQNPSASSRQSGKEATNPQTYAVYLNITKPFDIRDPKMRKTFIDDYVKGGWALGINPYTEYKDSTVSGLPSWEEADNIYEWMEENDLLDQYDGILVDEGGVPGENGEVISRGIAYITFSPEQVKNIDNLSPTSDPDIRRSIDVNTKDELDYYGLNTASKDYVKVQKAVRNKLKADGFFKENSDLVNKESDIHMSITPKGINETFNHDNYTAINAERREIKIALVRYLPEMFKEALLVNSDAKNYHGSNRSNYIYFQDRVIANGKDIIVDIQIKKGNEGNRFYLHHVNFIEKDSDDLYLRENDLPATEASSESDNSISQPGQNARTSREIQELRRAVDAPETDFTEMIGTKNDDTAFGGMASILEEGSKALKGQQVDKQLMRRIARKATRKYGSTYDINQFADNIARVFAYAQNNEIANSEDLARIMSEVALPVIEEAKGDSVDEIRKEVRTKLSGFKLDLSQRQHDEVVSAFGNYQNYKREMRKYGVEISMNGSSMDSSWVDIASALSGLIPESVNEGDQPIVLLDALKGLEKKQVSNGYGMNNEEAATDLALEIIAQYYEESGKQQVSQKGVQDKNIADLKKQVAEARKIADDYKKQIKKEYEERYDEALKDLKQAKQLASEETMLQVAALRAQNRHDIQRRLDAQEKAKQKSEIQKGSRQLLNMLANPTNAKHVPISLEAPVLDLLSSIDFVGPKIDKLSDGRYQTKVLVTTEEQGQLRRRFETYVGDTYQDVMRQYQEAMQSGAGSKAQRTWQQKLSTVKDLYSRAGTEGDSNSATDLLEMLDKSLLPDLQKILDDNDGLKTISSLNADELKTINKAIKNITTAINKIDKFYTSPESVSKLGNDIMEHAKKVMDTNVRSRAKETLKDFFTLDNATPETYFHGLGKSGEKVFRMLTRANNVKARDIRIAQEYMADLLKDVSQKDIDSMTGEKAKIIYEEGSMKLDVGDVMYLYMLLKRQDAESHKYGGFEMDDKEIKGKVYRDTKPHFLDEKMLRDITDKLTPKQKEIAEKMQQFLAVDCSEWGNETAILLYGYEKFTDPNYIPMTVDKKTVRTNAQNSAEGMINSIRESGFTKNVVPNANNPLIIRNIFDVFSEHVTNMAAYHAYAAPLTDVIRWNNFKTTEEIEEGDAKFGRQHTVKEAIDDIYGKGGQSYLVQLVRDINQMEKQTKVGTARFAALMSHYKAAATLANLRVVAQQPTAWFRAGEMIDAKYLAAGLAPNKAADKMQAETSDISWIKAQGNIDGYITHSMKNTITRASSTREKINDAAGWLAGKADDVTWNKLYRAVYAEQAAKFDGDLNSEEFAKKVNDRFDEVIARTQVVDGTLMRSQLMRSNDRKNIAVAAFMAEPTKSYNMFLRDYIDITQGKREGKKIRPEDLKHLTRTAAVYLVTNVANAVMQSIFDAERDDDEDKSYIEKLLNAFGIDTDSEKTFKDKALTFLEGNLADDLNMFHNIPIVKDIYDYVWQAVKKKVWNESTYSSGTSDMDIASIAELKKAFEYTFAKPENSKITLYGTVAQDVKALSQFTGIPAYNLMRECVALYNTLNDAWGGENIRRTAPTSAQLVKPVFDSIDTGSDYKAAIEKAVQKGSDYEKIETNITKQYKQQYIDLMREGKTDEAAKLENRLMMIYDYLNEKEGQKPSNKNRVKKFYTDWQKENGIEQIELTGGTDSSGSRMIDMTNVESIDVPISDEPANIWGPAFTTRKPRGTSSWTSNTSDWEKTHHINAARMIQESFQHGYDAVHYQGGDYARNAQWHLEQINKKHYARKKTYGSGGGNAVAWKSPD